jgi:SWI/SNF-related matrix-associated actin-dependent regulator 1 of chromatin subfamily A
VGVKYDYNSANYRDVEFKDGMKGAVEGMRWEGDPDWYWSIPPSAIPKLIEYFGGTKNVVADEAVKQMYRDEKARRVELEAIAAKEETDFVAPTLVPLRPYQNVGVEFVVRAGGRAMIADQMGLGKTATAIAYAIYKNRKTIIICPKSVKPGWVREVLRFGGIAACLWEGDFPIGDVDSKFHVVNYDIVDRHVEKFNKMGFDLMICDEATYLKNTKTKRSKAIMGYWQERKKYPGIKTKDLILLTGTPILNRPIEAYTLLNFISKERFGNKQFFIKQYGAADEKPRNLGELFQRTKDVVIRRLKKHVAKELPDKQRSDLLVELSPEDMKKYNKILDDMFRRWRASGKPSAAQMPTIQRFLLQFKLERAKEFIDEILAEGRSVLVFSTYQWVVEHLKAHYGPVCGMIHGGTNSKERQKVVDDLRDGYKKVGAFTINATGMGIDGLQNSIDTAIFLDQWWVPAVHEQAEDRLHRLGQKMKVMIYYMICLDTIDEDMRAVLAEKQADIDQAIDGAVINVARDKSTFGEVFKRIKERRKLDIVAEDCDDLPTIEQAEAA